MAISQSWANSEFGYISLFLLLAALRSSRVCCSNDLASCAAVRSDYAEMGYSADDVPEDVISGEHLNICDKGLTCCTRTVEQHLYRESKADFDSITGGYIGPATVNLTAALTGCDEFFTALIEESQEELHDMFTMTYGYLYQQMRDIFVELFDNLQDYAGADVHIADTLDNFFATLSQRLFQLLNSQYTYSNDYLECVAGLTDELRPFGDSPSRLITAMRSTFVVARGLTLGLRVGRDVTVVAAQQIPPTQSCANAVMKLLYCSHCKGVVGIKPCRAYCMNVMRGCMAHHADLNSAWNEYIDALSDLVQRLDDPQNIYDVMQTLGIRISDAMMTFQENSLEVTQKVFRWCGEPSVVKRGQPIAPVAREVDFTRNWSDRRRRARPTIAAAGLQRWARRVSRQVNALKDFWLLREGDDICGPLVAAGDTEQNNCWNGHDVGTYDHPIVESGVLAQGFNPEMDVDVQGNPHRTVIDQQILRLRMATNAMEAAYNGYDVTDGDTDSDSDEDGEGSGSSSDGY